MDGVEVAGAHLPVVVFVTALGRYASPAARSKDGRRELRRGAMESYPDPNWGAHTCTWRYWPGFFR